jgi:hypothetical protein
MDACPARGGRVSLAAQRRTFWLLLAAKLAGGWGLGWDIRWHILIGRDSFWIPPHVLTYASVVAVSLLSLGVLLAGTRSARSLGHLPEGAIRVAGLVGSRGFHLAWWGMAVTILAAPIDDLWHRMFGIDVTLWSPPHLLGLAGAQISTLGCLLIPLEVYAAGSGRRRAALLAAGSTLVSGFIIALTPGFRTAFLNGGTFFFTYAMLGGLLLAFPLVLVTRLGGGRWAPVVVVLGALAIQISTMLVASAGFALFQPVSALAEAIAADPASPIAIAHEIARRNGTVVGRSLIAYWMPLVPALLLTVVDARRRWTTAAGIFGLALAIANGLTLGRSPAFAQVLPGTGDTVIALVVTALTSLAGAWCAERLAKLFTAVDIPSAEQGRGSVAAHASGLQAR